MQLWLIRHAKSSWSSPAQNDFGRPLNRRGERDGPAMRVWLTRQPHHAQWIWVSDAVRAQATAAFVAQAFPGAVLQADRRLYGATPEALLEVIRETPGGIETVAVVAHNPGITWCVNLLLGEAAVEHLPTFGVALLQWPGGVEGLRPGCANLLKLSNPKAVWADAPVRN